MIETCESGHPGRHIWNFKDWFEQRCLLLSHCVEVAFRLGMLGLLGSVLTYIYAQLERGDPDASVQARV